MVKSTENMLRASLSCVCLFAVADSRYRGGRVPPNDVASASSASNVSKPSPHPAAAAQSSRSGGPPAKVFSDSSTRMRNGPVGAGDGKTPPSKVQNGQ